ncbi:beta-1,3-glucan-binding protein-like isoform X1 [Liolophura sinensis]|uniref:beta-1,3-glucan-binding protein-like isoform X1 n=1 Tax=Liolophura sinensis TaxID=3198878 RepID=UPI003158ABE5
MIGRILLLVCCVGVAHCVIRTSISRLQPKGIRFSVQDEAGVSLVGVHYSINKPIRNVEAGTFNYDVNSKTGSFWVHENRQVVLSPGDKVYYWVYWVKEGRGEQLLNQVWTVPSEVTQKPVTSSGSAFTKKPEVVSVHVNQPIPALYSASDSDPGTVAHCSSYPCVIFRDDFDSFDLATWQHEITAGGGGNWEFQFYTNNRSNSYVRDGTLYIKPTLTADKYGEAFLSSGTLDLWGGCTNNQWYGCERRGTAQNYINPIQSARLRTKDSFSFRYGRLEVEAKMPTGDWIWPAIWMLPTDNAYGDWPASGEIDLVESRGNVQLRAPGGHSIGVDTMASTLHFGPFWPNDPYTKAHVEKTLQSGTFGSSFHKYAVEWDENSIRFYLDNQLIKTVDPGAHGFWGLGGFPNVDNPWKGRGKMAPFDQKVCVNVVAS